MKKYIISFFALLTITALAQTPEWEFMGLAGEEIYDIAVDDSGNVFVASWTGIFKSTNNGATWAFKNNGLQVGDVNKLFIDYEGNIYLCGSVSFPGYGLYKSSDGGENWVGIADTLNNNPTNYFFDINIIPNEPGGIIYVSNEYGVYRSTDNGITWQSTNFTDPGATDIGINTNSYMFFGNNTASWFGIYRSTDLGLNWERHTFLGVESMVYLRDGSVLAGCYDPGLGSFGIYKTTDNGDTWFNTNTLNFGSTDFVLDINDDIYAASGYVYLSTDNGISWLNYGLPGQGAYWLTIDSSGYIWAGSHLDGVYRTAGRTVPVELTSFSAETINNNVLLSWVTASEINNNGFEIEKLVGSGQYAAGNPSNWEKIGFVEGNGTTTETKSYSFIDENVSTGIYQYRLKQIDFDGTFEYSNVIEIEVDLTPSQYSLEQNYPNPFNPATSINYQIPEDGFVSLKIYDILGNEIQSLVDEHKTTGRYEVNFNATSVASGVYKCKLTAGSFVSSKKMLLLK